MEEKLDGTRVGYHAPQGMRYLVLNTIYCSEIVANHTRNRHLDGNPGRAIMNDVTANSFDYDDTFNLIGVHGGARVMMVMIKMRTNPARYVP
jgi:hypothetical protein